MKLKDQYIVVFFLLVMFVLATTSMAQKSLTVDETTHLSSGYSYWKLFDYSLNKEHPPLMKLLAAAPLLIIQPDLSVDSETIEEASQWDVGKEMLFWDDDNDGDWILFWGRIPMVLVALLLGFFVWKWAYELYGRWAAFFALFLYILSPTILAHSRLVHTDLGITAFYFITTYFFWKLCKNEDKNKTRKYMWLTGLFFGLALAAKFSGIYLLGVFGLLFVVEIIYKILIKEFKKEVKLIDIFKKKETQEYLKKFLIVIILIVLIGCGVLVLSYGVKEFPNYIEGFKSVVKHSQVGHPAFLFGEHYNIGKWHYFPIAFLLKTPIPTLIFLGFGLYLFARKKWKNNYNELFLILPALLYFGLFLPNKINIGVRHVMPILPFVFVFVSSIINLEIKKKIWRNICIAIFAILCLWYLLSSLFIYPHYLAYFNEFAGGPDNGHNYLLDSNIDWGQDLKGLDKWLDENNIDDKITLGYFGHEDSNWRIGEFDRFKCAATPGIVAISANLLHDFQNINQGCTDWLNEYEPITKIGYSIFVYDINDEDIIIKELECKEVCKQSCSEQGKEYYDSGWSDKCLCNCA